MKSAVLILMLSSVFLIAGDLSRAVDDTLEINSSALGGLSSIATVPTKTPELNISNSVIRGDNITLHWTHRLMLKGKQYI